MKPLEMIAEWRKGCTIAGPLHQRCFPDGEPLSPGYCVECTEALIEALERALRRGPSEDQIERVAEAIWRAEWIEGHEPAYSWDAHRSEDHEQAEAYRTLARAAIAAMPDAEFPALGPIGELTTYRTGTWASPQFETVARLRDFLDAVLAVAEPSGDVPVPMVELPGGFFVTYSTTKQGPLFS